MSMSLKFSCVFDYLNLCLVMKYLGNLSAKELKKLKSKQRRAQKKQQGEVEKKGGIFVSFFASQRTTLKHETERIFT